MPSWSGRFCLAPRLFMNLQSDAVPEGMAKTFAVAGLLDHAAGGRVDVLHDSAWSDSFDRGLLSL